VTAADLQVFITIIIITTEPCVGRGVCTLEVSSTCPVSLSLPSSAAMNKIVECQPQ